MLRSWKRRMIGCFLRSAMRIVDVLRKGSFVEELLAQNNANEW
jgi:hypothetical protein